MISDEQIVVQRRLADLELAYERLTLRYRDEGLRASQKKLTFPEACKYRLGSSQSMAWMEGFFNVRMPRPLGRSTNAWLDAVDGWVDELYIDDDAKRIAKREYRKLFTKA